MSFLKEYKKDSKAGNGITLDDSDPTFFISTGNYLFNKILSGKYLGGIPQGMTSLLAGASSSGKSFIAGNVIREAQARGFGVLVVDSERALTKQFVKNIGANPDDDYYVYRGVTTISNAVKVISEFLKSYRKHNETKPFLIVMDSLDAMLTEAQLKAFDEGEQKGEMGQQVRQLKALMAPITQEIKDLNIAVICTKQVYRDQDPIKQKNPVTEFKITDAIQYAFTIIGLVSKLMLKNDTTKQYEGIHLRVFGFKTRFTAPFQRASIEVPYNGGMDPFSGLLEASEALGVVTRAGSWYNFNGTKFQSKNFKNIQEDLLKKLIEIENDDEHTGEDVINVKEDPELYITTTTENDQPKNISEE